jgi:hypothetical protein
LRSAREPSASTRACHAEQTPAVVVGWFVKRTRQAHVNGHKLLRKLTADDVLHLIYCQKIEHAEEGAIISYHQIHVLYELCHWFGRERPICSSKL